MVPEPSKLQESYKNIQEARLRSDTEMKEKKNLFEGTTSLSSILNEKSLFDEYSDSSRIKERKYGTDVRTSDHSEELLHGSKRNSINQKIGKIFICPTPHF